MASASRTGMSSTLSSRASGSLQSGRMVHSSVAGVARLPLVLE